MELKRNTVPGQIRYSGVADGIIVQAGQSLHIETSPGGSEILDVVVPSGKTWTVYVCVDITESQV